MQISNSISCRDSFQNKFDEVPENTLFFKYTRAFSIYSKITMPNICLSIDV